MKYLYEKVKERLSLIENMYDIVRIVDPVDKKAILIKDSKIEDVNGACYDCWNRGMICNNCISMRAYTENDTFVKIEHNDSKVILVTSAPLVIDEEVYVIEMLKDISNNGKIFDNDSKCAPDAGDMIKEINERVIRDGLTGVYNRKYIHERLPIDINNCIRHGYPLSVIMADIDHLKDVNYKYGHAAGDKVIRDFTKLIEGSTRRNSDWVGRYDGDEFLIVLNNTGKEDAVNISEKINNLLRDASFDYDGISIKITSSFGIYCTEDEKIDTEKILTEVNRKLNEAKRKIRNAVINDDYAKIDDDELSTLNIKIQELRDILNEMCISSDETVEYKQRLEMSQYLDELIVEYMKNITRK